MKIILPVVLQGIYMISSYYLYVIFSMLFFGEGQGSFMYSRANSLILGMIVFLLPFLYNVQKILSKSVIKKTKYKIATFINILVVIFACFLFNLF